MIVLEKGREKGLEMSHQAHPGISSLVAGNGSSSTNMCQVV